jgi:uncharacterized protein YjbI with pentapeptide repeats
MTGQDQVNLLRQGIGPWNLWRMCHSTNKPDLSRADLRGAELSGSNLSGSNLTGASLTGAHLFGADLREAHLTGAHLSGADLREAHLTGAHLSRADLREADLTGADIAGSNLTGAHLSGSHFTGSNLTGAYLTGAHLSGANLRGAHLTGADITGADLREADLTGAHLTGADLREADLTGALLSRADLREAHLTGARLIGADLTGAHLTGADLSEVRLLKANLGGADLSGCRVYGILAEDLTMDGETKQSDLVITQIGQSVIAVDSLELAQFITLLLDNEGIRDLIGTMTTKVVLLVGQFSPERTTVRDAMMTELRNSNLTPVLFEFKPQGARDLTGMVELVARMARFIIIDMTCPKSVPPELGAMLPHLERTPVLPLGFAGSSGYGIPDVWHENIWLLKTHEYRDECSLKASLRKVIELSDSLAEAP